MDGRKIQNGVNSLRMNIEKLVSCPEGRTLEFKQEAPKKLDNILRTVLKSKSSPDQIRPTI